MAKKTLQGTQKQKKQESWLSPQLLAMLTAIFIITQAGGILIAALLFNLGAQQPPFNPDINDITNGLYLFGVIIAGTIVILLLLRMRRTKKLLWVFEGLAIFSTSLIVFSALLPTNDLAALLLTALVLVIRYGHRSSVWARNLASMLAIIGAGSYLGISLGLIPVLAFVIILAVYDIIAVFYTKHMVTLGREVTKGNFAFTVGMPTKKHNFELGNGDLVIPLLVAASVLVNGPFRNNTLIAGACLIASFIGLLISLHSVSVWKRAMPALPPQTVLMVIVMVAALLLGL